LLRKGLKQCIVGYKESSVGDIKCLWNVVL